MDSISQVPFGVGSEIFGSLNFGVLDFVQCAIGGSDALAGEFGSPPFRGFIS